MGLLAFAIGILTGLFAALIILFFIGAAKLNDRYDHYDHMTRPFPEDDSQ